MTSPENPMNSAELEFTKKIQSAASPDAFFRLLMNEALGEQVDSIYQNAMQLHNPVEEKFFEDAPADMIDAFIDLKNFLKSRPSLSDTTASELKTQLKIACDQDLFIPKEYGVRDKFIELIIKEVSPYLLQRTSPHRAEPVQSTQKHTKEVTSSALKTADTLLSQPIIPEPLRKKEEAPSLLKKTNRRQSKLAKILGRKQKKEVQSSAVEKTDTYRSQPIMLSGKRHKRLSSEDSGIVSDLDHTPSLGKPKPKN